MKRTSKGIAMVSVASAAALVGLAAGGALAAPADHSAIKLKGPGGLAITKNADGTATAFSMKTTCFTAGCHQGVDADGNPLANGGGKATFSYNDIESHNYHAQLGANEFKGYNPFNVDAYDPYFVNADGSKGKGDKWRPGAGPQGKNWVQSSGHVGSW